MTEKKESIGQTLTKFRAKVKLEKTRKNTFTKSLYANLDDVWNAAIKVMPEVGLHYLEAPIPEGDKLMLRAKVVNDYGDIHEGAVELRTEPAKQNENPEHTLGASLTYRRRYLMCTLLGIVEGHDDDGQYAVATSDAQPAAEGTIEQIKKILHDNPEKDTPEFRTSLEKSFGTSVIDELTAQQATHLLSIMARKK